MYVTASTVVSAEAMGLPSALRESPNYGLPSSLWLGRLGGPESIDPPPGDSIFQIPRGAMSPESTFHLVWAEPHPKHREWLRQRSKERRDHTSLDVHSVLYSRYSGGKWCAPEALFSVDTSSTNLPVWWAGQGPGFRAGPKGRLHLFFGVQGLHAEAMYFRRSTDGHWRRDTLETYGGTERSLAFGDDGGIVRAYIGHAGRHSESVIVSRSSNDGQDWSDTTVVRRGSRGMSWADSANEVRLLGSPADTLHLVWGWNVSGAMSHTNELWHAYSTDRGRTWASPVKLEVPARPMMELDVVEGACGRLHAILLLLEFRTREGKQKAYGRVYYTQFDGAQWSSLRSLSRPSTSVSGVALTRWRRSLQAIWGQAPRAGEGAPVTVYRRICRLESADGPRE